MRPNPYQIHSLKSTGSVAAQHPKNQLQAHTPIKVILYKLPPVRRRVMLKASLLYRPEWLKNMFIGFYTEPILEKWTLLEELCLSNTL